MGQYFSRYSCRETFIQFSIRRNFLSHSAGVLCKDEHVECEQWAKDGSCSSETEYMFKRCQVSCKKLNFPLRCDLKTLKLPLRDQGTYNILTLNNERSI